MLRNNLLSDIAKAYGAAGGEGKQRDVLLQEITTALGSSVKSKLRDELLAAIVTQLGHTPTSTNRDDLLTQIVSHYGGDTSEPQRNDLLAEWLDALQNQGPPSIIRQPVGLRGIENEVVFDAVFSPNADSYQWQYQLDGEPSWTNASGYNEPEYDLSLLATDTNMGTRCVLTNTNGSTTTNESLTLVRPNNTQLWSVAGFTGLGGVAVTNAGYQPSGLSANDVMWRSNVGTVGTSVLNRTFQISYISQDATVVKLVSQPSGTESANITLSTGKWFNQSFTVADNDTQIEMVYVSGPASNHVEVEVFQLNPELPKISTHPTANVIFSGTPKANIMTADADSGNPTWFVKLPNQIDWEVVPDGIGFTGVNTKALSYDGTKLADDFVTVDFKCRFSGEGLHSDTYAAVITKQERQR